MLSMKPLLLGLACFSAVFAQSGRVTLRGHLHPRAVAENDRGRVNASAEVRHITLILQPSDARQAALAAFLERQQDATSPDFHRWLTPAEYGERFGLDPAELDTIRTWLTSQGLTVDAVGPARNSITFSGAVRTVEQALQTEIHNYAVNGETHFANATEPAVPAAWSRFVRAFRGLDNFRMKPNGLRRAPVQPDASQPNYNSATTGNHFLAPEDVSTVFNLVPIYNTGITGQGQSLVVVGQTQINLSDIRQFRTYFNLSANDPRILAVPNKADPGVSKDDVAEADLDLEWAGAIAREASIIYVYSANVEDALEYAINQNLAPVITMSYGLCEGLESTAYLQGLRTYAQQATAQGISWITSSGDSGANSCYGISSRGPTGLSVNSPASIPEVTGIGGTTLTEGTGAYWNAANNPNHASALAYIPESVWNDSSVTGSPSSSGGGASAVFGKPSWQVGAGVPDDGRRDVPDVSLPASAAHDAYLVYSGGILTAFGGTSVGSPVFAGMAALLNQYLTANALQTAPGLGNMNPRLYALAQASPGIFHDVIAGDNKVDSCAKTVRTCVPVSVGYSAGTGYDLATGLGSFDAWSLITAWHPVGAPSAKPAPQISVLSSLTALSVSDTAVLTATVVGSGTDAPTGTVGFYLAGTLLGSGKLSGSGNTATATLSVSGSQFSAGTPAVSALYGGDGNYASAQASVTVTVTSGLAPAVKGLTSAASFKASYAPGMIVAMFGDNLASGTPEPQASPLPTQVAGTSVTVNGIAAPLYYVSPTQINFQIPYEIPAASTAILKVSANGQSTTTQIAVSANAPGIFTDATSQLVPYQATGHTQTVVLFMTGEGAVSPQPITGSVPAAGAVPVPLAKVSVTVGGVPATTTFVGVPGWSIGVTQINFAIPAGAPLGVQPVVVKVGSISSPAAYITVAP